MIAMKNMNQCAEEAVFFRFEEDFIGDGIRCIPMIVRFKLDACGIKLKLSEWSRMTSEQRMYLAEAGCSTLAELIGYREYLYRTVVQLTGEPPTLIPVEENPAWSRKEEIPYPVKERLQEISLKPDLSQWQQLTDLQRFALLKLSYSGHEHRNFRKALVEFEF